MVGAMSPHRVVIKMLGPLGLENLKLDNPSLQALAYVVREQEKHQPVTVEEVAELLWGDKSDPSASFKVSRSNVNKQTKKAFGFNLYERPNKGVLNVVNVVSDVELLEKACAAKNETEIRRVCTGTFFGKADVTGELNEWVVDQQRQVRRMVWNAFLTLATQQRDKTVFYVQTAFTLVGNELPDNERQTYRVNTLQRLYYLLQTIDNAREKVPEEILEYLPSIPVWEVPAKEAERYLQLWQTEDTRTTGDTLEQRLRFILKENYLNRFDQMAVVAQDLFQQNEERLSVFNKSDLLLVYYALQAVHHPLAQQASQKLRLTQTSSDQARVRLVTSLLFLDRKRVQKTLNNLIELREGKWAWVYGKPGTGKSLLLEQLPGFKLEGKPEPPYETVTPLLEKDLAELGNFKEAEQESHKLFLLGRLVESLTRSNTKTLLVDNWEKVDLESQALLIALHQAAPSVGVIFTSTSKTPPKALSNIQVLELGNLSRDEIERDINELFEQTGGIPELVAANLKDDSISDALKRVLANLSDTARRFYLGQALLDRPNHELLCKALGVSEAERYDLQNELTGFGLMLGSGDINPREVARTYLVAEAPREFTTLSFALAKVLPSVEALLHFHNARVHWNEKDYTLIEKSYLEYVANHLDRESPQRLLDLLEEVEDHFSQLSHSRHPDFAYRKAQLFLQLGDSFRALELVNTLEETPKVLALKAELLLLANDETEAETCAQHAASSSDKTAKATALNTLGKICFYREVFDQALTYFEQAGKLWRTLGQRVKYARALMNQAHVRSEQARLRGTVDDEVMGMYQQVLEASVRNPLLSPQVFQNQGIQHHLRAKLTGDAEGYVKAEASFKHAIEEARAMALKVSEAEIQCNLAETYVEQVLLSKRDKGQAENALDLALQLSTPIADDGLIARVKFFKYLLSNVPDMVKRMEEAIQTLLRVGREVEARELCQYLPVDNALRLRLEEEKKKKT